MDLQLLNFWTAVVLYAVSTVLSIIGFVFSKNSYTKISLYLSGIALLPLTIAIYNRWVTAGHGPYLKSFEVLSGDAWMVVVVFLLVQWRYPKIRPVGIFVMPVVFIMLGIGLLQNQRIENSPETFNTIWLVIHIIFAKLAYGSSLISASLAIFYLIKNKKGDTPLLSKLPDLKSLDYLVYRMAGFSFIMLTIMITTGAIWANQAWGRYWGWDAIETWAFISWLIYGLYLHLRFTFKIKPTIGAWLSIIALLIVLFTLFGSSVIYESIHSEYLG